MGVLSERDPLDTSPSNKAQIVMVVVVGLIIVGLIVFWVTRPSPDGTNTNTTNTSEQITNANRTTNTNSNANKNSNTNVNSATPAKPTVVELTAKNYEYSQKEIRVSSGTTLIVKLTSNQGIHDVVFEGLDVASDRIASGETAEVTFDAERKGTFTYYCSVGDHRQMGMTGKLIVE